LSRILEVFSRFRVTSPFDFSRCLPLFRVLYESPSVDGAVTDCCTLNCWGSGRFSCLGSVGCRAVVDILGAIVSPVVNPVTKVVAGSIIGTIFNSPRAIVDSVGSIEE
jgi:hypothetical protein